MARPASVLNGDGLSVQELREALAQTQHALAAAQRQLCEQAQIFRPWKGWRAPGTGGATPVRRPWQRSVRQACATLPDCPCRSR